MERIPYQEVEFHAHSFADPDGRLFYWKGGLYRAISSKQTPFFTRLFRDGLMRRLIDKGLLIETELTSLVIDGYELVVRHRRLPFTTYAHEWCAPMFKEAALTIIDLNIELLHHGLTLKDCHPWNVLFDGHKPVYVDLTSIVPLKETVDWPRYDSFCRYCLHPLILMSYDQAKIAKWLLWEYEGILKTDVLMLTRGFALSGSNLSILTRLKLLLSLQYSSRNRSRGQDSQLNFLRNLKGEVEGIGLPFLRSKLPDHLDPHSFSCPDTWTEKQQVLNKILGELGPKSLLDIASSTGWYSQLAALRGSKVVSFDPDPRCVTQLYYVARERNLSILPLVMDFARPTPARGLANECFIAASERFQCDMVLALEWVHNLVLRRSLNFDQIVEGLARFSKRWAIVEFVSLEGQEVPDLQQKFPWYTLDNFIEALKKWFRNVRVIPSEPRRRVLLLCEK